MATERFTLHLTGLLLSCECDHIQTTANVVYSCTQHIYKVQIPDDMVQAMRTSLKTVSACKTSQHCSTHHYHGGGELSHHHLIGWCRLIQEPALLSLEALHCLMPASCGRSRALLMCLADCPTFEIAE
jgi:hypothetical protein